MSADAPQSTLASALGVQSAPVEIAREVDVVTEPPPAPIEVIKPALPAKIARLTVIGYSLLVIGTLAACLLRFVRLRGGIIEPLVILLAIVLVLVGAGLAIWSYIQPMLGKK